MAEPVLRWAGGKTQIIRDITSRLPPEDEFNKYYEPFFGGGAVFFKLEPSNGYINDINERLMNFYKHLKQNPDEIVKENRKLDDKLENASGREEEKELYYDMRDEFNSLPKNGECSDKSREAVLFLFLNRTCWNGLYRTNEAGEFNVRMNSKPTFTDSVEEKIRQGSRILQNTNINSKDFEYIAEEVEENDLVFLDPPYKPESDRADSNFNKYSPGGFGEGDQERVRDLASELDKRGAYVMITNSPEAKDIYKNDRMENFRIVGVRARRAINSDSSQRKNLGVTDIIITNSPQFWEHGDFDDFR